MLCEGVHSSLRLLRVKAGSIYLKPTSFVVQSIGELELHSSSLTVDEGAIAATSIRWLTLHQDLRAVTVDHGIHHLVTAETTVTATQLSRATDVLVSPIQSIHVLISFECTLNTHCFNPTSIMRLLDGIDQHKVEMESDQWNDDPLEVRMVHRLLSQMDLCAARV